MSISQDFIVNSTSLGVSYSLFAPTVATLADGRTLVAWVKVAPGDFVVFTDPEICARWFNADGTPLGEDFVVNTTLDGYQWRPSATATAEGTVVVTWESGDGLGVRAIVLDPELPGASTDFMLTEAATGHVGSFNSASPDVTALSDGRFFAVWSNNDGSDGNTFGVQGRFFDAAGTPLDTPMLLNSTSLGNQITPSVTELSDGRILVTFVRSFDGTTNDGGIRARVIQPDGSVLAEDFQVNTTTVGYQASVDVTALSGGRAVAVWFNSGPIVPDEAGGNPNVGPGEIRAQVIGADGRSEGSDFVVNATHLDFNYGYPAVTTLANGTALVVWHSGDHGDGDWGCLRGRVLDADGKPVSLDFVINSTQMNNQSSPALEALPDGRVLVTWSSDEGSGAGAQTRGVYFTPVIGDTGADSLVGTGDMDVMMGLGGDDQIAGQPGDDSQMGGTGNDSLISGAGDDLQLGQAGADLLNGGRGADMLTGGTGADSLMGGAGADTICFDTGSGRDKVMDFAQGDLLQITEDLWSGSIADLLANQTRSTDQGMLIQLGHGDQILSLGVTSTDGWVDAIVLI